MRIHFNMTVHECLDYLGPIRSARTAKDYVYWLHGRRVDRKALVAECLRLEKLE